MFCKNCGKEINENAAVCIHCGVSAGSGNKYCSNCGAQPDPLAIVCIKCGAPLKKKNPNKKTVNSFGGAISACFSKYATFSGRANRSEYWFWVLFYFIFAIIPMINFVAVLVFFLPSLAVLVRRLHDTGRSGWWYFIALVPFIGWIWLLVLLCKESEEGENEYGVNPN